VLFGGLFLLKGAVERGATLEYHGRTYEKPLRVAAGAPETAALHLAQERIHNRTVFVSGGEPPAFVYLLRGDGSYTRYGLKP
jgi:hypothetical protein